MKSLSRNFQVRCLQLVIVIAIVIALFILSIRIRSVFDKNPKTIRVRFRFSLGFLFGCRGQCPIPNFNRSKEQRTVAYFCEDFCFGLLLTAPHSPPPAVPPRSLVIVIVSLNNLLSLTLSLSLYLSAIRIRSVVENKAIAKVLSSSSSLSLSLSSR